MLAGIIDNRASMDMDWTNIVVAALAAASPVLVALIGYWGLRQKKKAEAHGSALQLAEQEIDFRRDSLSLKVDLQKWGVLEEKLQHLCETTEVDRFLILRCWNGTEDPRWTTAIYQYRLGDQEMFAYISVDLDQDYVKRLNVMRAAGMHDITLEQIPECLIKRIYEAEGVAHSVWFPLVSHSLPSSGAVAHTYCSFASHEGAEMSLATRQKCQNLSWEIREAMA